MYILVVANKIFIFGVFTYKNLSASAVSLIAIRFNVLCVSFLGVLFLVVVYICIYTYGIHNCPQLIPLCDIAISLLDVVFESTLLNCANPCRNWTFQRFARVAEKKERNGTNKKI